MQPYFRLETLVSDPAFKSLRRDDDEALTEESGCRSEVRGEVARESMENFLQAFFAVDTDNSETITRDELVAFMKVNHFKPAFVEVSTMCDYSIILMPLTD